MRKKEIAIAYSTGEFEIIFDYIAEDAVWVVIEENKFEGKENIINNCKQVSQYFKSVETDFKTIHVVEEENLIVVNGTAEFLREGKRISFVNGCDIYEFNAEGKIYKITSYCIQERKK